MVDRWVWAEIDLDAVGHNVEVLRAVAAPAACWAVVKADAYGHGAVDVARVAIDAGAEGLCVALPSEGARLRQADVEVPILVLSQQPPESYATMLHHRLTPTVYTVDGVRCLAAAAAAAGVRAGVHVKVDTGMQRVGVAPGEVRALLTAIEQNSSVIEISGVFTHLATADDPRDPATAQQLDRFDQVLHHEFADLSTSVIVHAANSAGALAHPRSHRSMVRCGIAVYGISPGSGVDPLCGDLQAVMSLHARVSHVKQVVSGSRISYGLRHTFEHDTIVATVPLGYADGVPRRLASTGGEVLIGGRRRQIVGVITMDQLMVDMGADPTAVGDPVVLIGRQGDEQITAEEWADRLGTIGYEVVCGISSRVERLPRRSIGG